MKYFVAIVFGFIASSVIGQKLFDQHSLDLSFGYSQPLNYFEDNFGVNLGVNHTKLGYRYMPNRHIGIRANFSYDRFKSASTEKTTSVMNHYSLDLVYNLGRSIRLPQITNNKFTILFYGGGGFTRHKLPQVKATERCGLINIGLTPVMIIQRRFAFTADLCHSFTLRQHYDFNGVLLKDNSPVVGRQFGISLGMMFYLGTWEEQTDVY